MRAACRLVCWSVLLCTVRICPGYSQETQTAIDNEFAVLLRGPFVVEGLDFLGPNTLSAFRGIYRLGEFLIEVSFIRTDLVSARNWPTIRCGEAVFREIPDDELRGVYLGEIDRYALFIRFPFSFERWCDFVDAYVDRFRRLMTMVKSDTEVPFPAIVELRVQ